MLSLDTSHIAHYKLIFKKMQNFRALGIPPPHLRASGPQLQISGYAPDGL